MLLQYQKYVKINVPMDQVAYFSNPICALQKSEMTIKQMVSNSRSDNLTDLYGPCSFMSGVDNGFLGNFQFLYTVTIVQFSIFGLVFLAFLTHLKTAGPAYSSQEFLKCCQWSRGCVPAGRLFDSHGRRLRLRHQTCCVSYWMILSIAFWSGLTCTINYKRSPNIVYETLHPINFLPGNDHSDGYHLSIGADESQVALDLAKNCFNVVADFAQAPTFQQLIIPWQPSLHVQNVFQSLNESMMNGLYYQGAICIALLLTNRIMWNIVSCQRPIVPPYNFVEHLEQANMMV
jgi:hypothetical protein